MKLFDVTDGLLVGTKYLAWGLGVLGILGSALLFVGNLPLGIGSALVFIAAFFLSVSVALLLLPKKLAEGKLFQGKLEGGKRYLVGSAALVIALVVMFFVWNMNGGFPNVNLFFA